MAIGDTGRQPILFGVLGGRAGGSRLGRQYGGVGPLRPWLKAWYPQITDTQYEAPARRDYPGLKPVILYPLGSAGLNRGHQRVSFSRMLPLPAPYLKIFGITKNGAGTALPGCTVHLFETATDKFVEQSVSDGVGYYEFRSASLSTAYFVVAYNATGPVAGTTINTLVGT